MSDQTTVNRETASPLAPGSEALLRDTLKRCSDKTLEAALAYRETGDVSYVPVVVLGIVERFLDPDVADKLRSGDDSIEFMADLGLDSLTMIEAIMMVEESLGVSIKNEELLDLRSVGDLKSFIKKKIAGEANDSSQSQFALDQVAAIMPQQSPFLFLSQATLTARGAEGSYEISGSENFLEGHFKGNPVFPASIMLEALGQLAVFKLIKDGASESSGSIESSEIYFTGADGVRCHRICKPGDTLSMSVQVKRVREPLAVFSGQITVNGEKAVVAEEITLAFRSDSADGSVEDVSPINGEHVSSNGSH
jgi:acyl carrier protein